MRRSTPRYSRPALALAAVLLSLSSCIDVTGNLAIAADGSARFKMRYAVSKMALSLDAIAADSPFLPFPLTRAAFDAALSALPGSSLISWTQAESRDDLVTNAELSFPDLASLVRFVDPSGQKARYAQSGTARSLAIQLWPGVPGSRSLDPELAKLVGAAFEPYRLALTVSSPSRVAQAGIGVASADGRTVQCNRKLAELAASPEPVVWEIRW